MGMLRSTLLTMGAIVMMMAFVYMLPVSIIYPFEISDLNTIPKQGTSLRIISMFCRVAVSWADLKPCRMVSWTRQGRTGLIRFRFGGR